MNLFSSIEISFTILLGSTSHSALNPLDVVYLVSPLPLGSLWRIDSEHEITILGEDELALLVSTQKRAELNQPRVGEHGFLG